MSDYQIALLDQAAGACLWFIFLFVTLPCILVKISELIKRHK